MRDRDIGAAGRVPESSARARPHVDADNTSWRALLSTDDFDEFNRSWMALQVHAIPRAFAGLLVLGPPDTGPFIPAAHWPEGRVSLRRLGEAAERAMRDRTGVVLRRAQPDPHAESREVVHVALPIKIGDQLHGVVAVEVAPRPDTELQSVMRSLQWGIAWLEVRFRRDDEARRGTSESRLRTVMDLVATSVGQDGFQATGAAFVNELASRLACDRATFGLVRRGRVHVQAMSNSSSFDKKTNLVRSIEAAMEEVLDQEEPVLHPPLEERGFQVTLAHQELARQYGLGALCSIPLGRDGAISGVVTLERPSTLPFDQSVLDLVEATACLVGPVLELERRDERWITTKVFHSLAVQVKKLTGPEHAILKLVASLLVFLVLFFAFAKMEYRVSAETVLEPEVQRAAVAPFNGYVREANKRAGDLVRLGDVLAVLDDRDLTLERHRLASQREQHVKQYNQALAERNAADVRIIASQIQQVDAQLSLADDQLSRTKVVSPFDGIIVNGDLSQAIGSPTERGQVLFEVAPLDAYRVILEVDERDVGAVREGQIGTVILSAYPTQSLPIDVQRVTPVSTASEGRNFFRVEAKLREVPTWMRPGMQGIGKVEAGRRRIIWIWTHRAIDWVRMFWWKWSP